MKKKKNVYNFNGRKFWIITLEGTKRNLGDEASGFSSNITEKKYFWKRKNSGDEVSLSFLNIEKTCRINFTRKLIILRISQPFRWTSFKIFQISLNYRAIRKLIYRKYTEKKKKKNSSKIEQNFEQKKKKRRNERKNLIISFVVETIPENLINGVA